MTSEERRNTDLPDRRQGTHASLEQKLDEHVARIERRFHKRFLGMLAAFSAIGLTSFAALLGYGKVIHDLKVTRITFIRYTCESQNQRHDKVIAELDRQIAKLPPKDREEARKSRDANVAILEALSPKQNCNALSKVATGEKKPPPPTPKPTESP